MQRTTASKIALSQKFLINTKELQELLSCGRYSAVKIGTDAGARVEIGKRVLWNRAKIERYVLDIAI